MSGMVTQSRVLSKREISYRTRYGTYPWNENVQTIDPETQTTTSYRTTGGTEGEDQDLREAARVLRNGFSYNPEFDHGHEFFTTRTRRTTSHPYWEGWAPTNPGWSNPSGYQGPLLAMGPGNYFMPSFPALRRMTDSDIRSYGSRAVSASSPTAPQAALSTLTGEVLLDGGLPYLGSQTIGLRGFKSASAKRAGSDYLNSQFGWLPVYADVVKLVNSLKSANATIKQLEKDAGQNVRRRFVFPTEQTVTETVLTGVAGSTFGGQSAFYNVDPLILQGSGDGGAYEVHVMSSRKRDIYFRGCFTYHMDLGNDIRGKLTRFEQLGNKLLGTRLNASALWELAPWSWLVDWQSTIGVALGNASMLSEDGLVMRYGYLMCHTVDTDTYTTRGLSFRGGTLGDVHTQYRRETKERVRATPFGFGLDLSTFSAKQWSILAALGMTRGNNSLRLTS
ncbi:maturation protein [ssRNA phage Esthiorhiza.1_11]|uniref:Maturation protein n=2 Tax=Leviviricetes TaxID=2842243 RepID=A0A8S5KXE1_9VIRU|nr:maturation protein [ssRNA phage Esthiorhiza.1_11]QDH90716.1 MAG: hypothetical protein H1RhizoLitter1485_000001 [Leviviridae sp.]DAD49929.1 TPA_asm: maturation protein [ssRNA phage Esthiorhiza.1_11]